MDAGKQNTINLKIDALLNHRVGSVAPLHLRLTLVSNDHSKIIGHTTYHMSGCNI